MEIIYLGHSAFRLRGKEVTIVTDPFPPGLGLCMGKISGDIVTVSHPSPHHCFISGVSGGPRVVDGPGEYEISDVLIAGVATSRAGVGTDGKMANTAYVLRFDDLVVCHLGDLRQPLTDQQVEEVGSIDVLLVPVGGGGALSPSEAAQVVSQLEPSIVIPMHFQMNGAGAQPTTMVPVDHFCREMGRKDLAPEQKLSVSKSSLPSEVQLVVLENRRV